MKDWLPEEEFQKLYTQHLQSEEWGKTKARAYALYGKFCQACGKQRGLCVHHADYGKLGKEPLEDLRILCKRCHKNLHKKFINSKRKDLRVFTDQYIRNKGEPPMRKHQKTLWIGGKLVKKKTSHLSTGNYCVDNDYLIEY